MIFLLLCPNNTPLKFIVLLLCYETMYAFVYDLAQPLNANHRNIFDIQRALPVGSKHLFEVN